MKKNDRLKKIDDYIEEHQSVSTEELLRVFEISGSTLQRDLNVLISSGHVIHSYGKVVSTKWNNELYSRHSRNSEHAKEKQQAARIAAQEIEDGDVVFIDSGSTVAFLIDYIDPSIQVTVVTNNIDIIIHGSKFENLDIYVLPGKINRLNNSISYLHNESFLTDFNINKIFMSCTGIDIHCGVSHEDSEERAAKKFAMERTSKRFLLVDSSKFGKIAQLHLSKISDFSVICTDKRPPEEYIAYCLANHVELKYA